MEVLAVFVLDVTPEFLAVMVTESVAKVVAISRWESVFPDRLNALFPFEVMEIVEVPATDLV